MRIQSHLILVPFFRWSALSSWVALSAFAADWRGQGHVWLGPGYDSNAARDILPVGERPLGDAFVFGLVQLDGLLRSGPFDVSGAYDAAGRLFFSQSTENNVIQSASLEPSVVFGDFRVAAVARARDRRGAERDYTDLTVEGAFDWFATEGLSLRLRLGAERFLFRPRFNYSFYGPTAALSARYRFTPKHSVSLSANAGLRRFNGTRNDNPKTEADETTFGSRNDTVYFATLGYTYRGRFQWGVNYTFFNQLTNSFGEGFRRHRFNVSAGLKLPGSFFVLGNATLQLSQFPDGVFLSRDLQVIEDDENSSFVTVKILRPLNSVFELDLRYALYVNVFPNGGDYLYVRHVVSAGVSVNF